jgi:uncharacterized damage-inducible protein DinB
MIEKQIDGISHKDSLLQPPFRGNCLNWVIGHMAFSRDGMIKAMGGQPVLDKNGKDIYDRGSDPITNGEQALPLETLVDALKEAATRLKDLLGKTSIEELAIDPQVEGFETLGFLIGFLLWHETYHTGQLEYLRQLTGVNDSVIP